MSYTYLQEQGEESLAECYSDIPAYVLSRLNLIAEKSSCNDNGTESCQSSQSGMMSVPSMESRGEEKSMSSAVDSPARTFQPPARALASRAKEAGFGSRWRELFVRYDRDTHSLKTHLCLWEEDLQPSSVILPKWGMMQNGVFWERATPVETICGKEYGFLPTVRRSGQTRAFKAYDRGENYKGNFEEFLGKIGFTGYIQNQLGEALMMWPIGWTDIAQLEMGKFRKWLQRHSRY